MNICKKVKTRIAPSPTGYASIGNLRTALFNYLFAKKNNGEFLLRIEDTDQERFVDGAEEYVIKSLNWLGLNPDYGVDNNGKATYRQSEQEYDSFIEILLKNGHAYYAFDTAEELESMRKSLQASGVKNIGYNYISRERMKNSFTLPAVEVKSLLDSNAPYVIRFNTPRNKEIKFSDIIKGEMIFNSSTLDDKILLKFDKKPTYHICNVVDDYRMEITHVIRGEEWLPSTPLHIMLYEAFGWEKPYFAHLPLVLAPDGSKISKRKAKDYDFPICIFDYIDTNELGEKNVIKGFADMNYESDALINFLALLGWSPGNNLEFMSLEDMVNLFDLSKINNSGARFDVEKLKNFNKHYLKLRDNLILFYSYIWNKEEPTIYDLEAKNGIVNIAKERSVFAKDLYPSVSYFFEPIVFDENVTLKNPIEFKNTMDSFLNTIMLPDFKWDSDFIKATLDDAYNNLGYAAKKVLPDLRLALTGGASGAHLQDVMVIIGKNESIKRINDLINIIKL